MTNAPFSGPAGPGAAPPGGGQTRSLSCPGCGAAIPMRGLGWTQTVVCPSCSRALDARDPNLRVLHSFARAMKEEPLIPLGSRGQWRGALREVIGFQVRRITVDDVPYSWREYLLFNPYHGFRYLTEYEGHWNDVTTVHGLPVTVGGGEQLSVRFGGRTYRHFQTARTSTVYVIGEFPWEVRGTDTVRSRDYVDPPYMLSSEEDSSEVTWSAGEYADPGEIWRAFKLRGAPPAVRGVFANQPNLARQRSGALWRLCLAGLAALFVLGVARQATARNDTISLGAHRFEPRNPSVPFVTPSFELQGDRANVEIALQSDIANSWMFVNYALVEERTGQVFDFGREVSRYSGSDADGTWTEGSPRDRAKIGGVPGGRYFLRVEAEGPGESTRPVQFDLTIRRDVPSFRSFFLAMLALLVPPLIASLGAASFEQRRWAESDHAPAASDDEDDE